MVWGPFFDQKMVLWTIFGHGGTPMTHRGYPIGYPLPLFWILMVSKPSKIKKGSKMTKMSFLIKKYFFNKKKLKSIFTTYNLICKNKIIGKFNKILNFTAIQLFFQKFVISNF